jgi:hypothetical protein
MELVIFEFVSKFILTEESFANFLRWVERKEEHVTWIILQSGRVDIPRDKFSYKRNPECIKALPATLTGFWTKDRPVILRKHIIAKYYTLLVIAKL